MPGQQVNQKPLGFDNLPMLAAVVFLTQKERPEVLVSRKGWYPGWLQFRQLKYRLPCSVAQVAGSYLQTLVVCC